VTQVAEEEISDHVNPLGSDEDSKSIDTGVRLTQSKQEKP
jgi:hypothetical protein